jgi:AmmeMemoRadiSam system protein A
VIPVHNSERPCGDQSGFQAQLEGVVRMHPLVELATKAIDGYVRDHRRISPPPPAEMIPEMKEKAGVFVSIHTKDGNLRGCIGTFEPTQANVAQEIISNAISAATRDPRFYPIQPEELNDLDISVDILTSPEPVENIEELDPKKHGMIVHCGWRRGLLLPDLEGVDTTEEQIEICRRKAGIGPREKVTLECFQVRRYH